MDIVMEYKKITEFEEISLIKELLEESYSNRSEMSSPRGVSVINLTNTRGEDKYLILMEFNQRCYGNTYYNKIKIFLKCKNGVERLVCKDGLGPIQNISVAKKDEVVTFTVKHIEPYSSPDVMKQEEFCITL